MDRIIEQIVEKYWENIKNKKNVIGYSGVLQPKIIFKKKYPKRMSFRIYVEKKEFARDLRVKDLIPRALKLGEFYETDIIEIGKIVALDNKERVRPIVGGVSTMHKDGTACTINGFFRDNETNEILVASNNHCYALENKASIGDSILQPGPYDGGVYPQDQIGKLVKYVKIIFNEFACPLRRFLVNIKRRIIKEQLINKVDIAFASIEVPYDIMATHVGKYKGRAIFSSGDKVTKTGRTTEQTSGEVFDVAWNGIVQYSRGVVFYTDCYLIQGDKFSQGGDSGSPVFDMNNNYGGALFAGSDTTTIVCKLDNIELEGNVTLVTS